MSLTNYLNLYVIRLKQCEDAKEIMISLIPKIIAKSRGHHFNFYYSYPQQRNIPPKPHYLDYLTSIKNFN